MRIGTMFFGEVDTIDSQCIETKFFVLGVPLFPIGSYFFIDRHSRQGMEIPLHGKSVLAGYVRMGLGIVALILAIHLYAMSSYRREVGDWITMFLFGAAFLASLFVLGRLSRAEIDKRKVLFMCTGLSADPAILSNHHRAGIETTLQRELEKDEVPIQGPAAWRQLIAQGDGPYRAAQQSPVSAATWQRLYAYARYASIENSGWRSELDELWKRANA